MCHKTNVYLSFWSHFLIQILAFQTLGTTKNTCLEVYSSKTAEQKRIQRRLETDPKFEGFRRISGLAESGAVLNDGQRVPVKIIPARNISGLRLGQPVGIRPDTLNLENVPTKVEELKTVTLLSETDLFIDNGDALEGKPREFRSKLGVLADGTPVAVFRLYSNPKDPHKANQFKNRVLSANLISELGIGPKFYGVVGTPEQQTFVVALTPGNPLRRYIDLTQVLSFQALESLRLIDTRLAEVGKQEFPAYSDPGDLIFIDGQIMAAAAGDFVSDSYAGNKGNSRIKDPQNLKLLMGYLPYAYHGVSMRYLQNLVENVYTGNRRKNWDHLASALFSRYNFELGYLDTYYGPDSVETRANKKAFFTSLREFLKVNGPKEVRDQLIAWDRPPAPPVPLPQREY